MNRGRRPRTDTGGKEDTITYQELEVVLEAWPVTPRKVTLGHSIPLLLFAAGPLRP